MRKLYVAIGILVLSGFFFKASASKLTDKARSDYTFQLTEYRREYREFDIKRSQHENIQTFAAQEELVKEAREMLRQRAEVWRVYLQLLRTRLAETNGMDVVTKSDLEKRIVENQKTISEHRDRLANLTTREELLEESKKFEDLSEDLSTLSYQTMGQMSIGKLQEIHDLEKKLTSSLKAEVPQQLLSEQAQNSRLRGFEEVERTLSLAQDTIGKNVEGSRQFDIYDQQRAFAGFTEALIPAYGQLERAHSLLTELSVGLEL